MAAPTFDPSQPFQAIEGETLDTLVPSVRAPVVRTPATPTFDPAAPFTSVPEPSGAPVFDPTKPFTPAPEASPVYTLDTFRAKPAEELAKDKSFSPVQFGAQFFSKGEGTPEEIEKLRQVYVAKEAEGTTALEKAKSAFAGVLPALKTIAGGVSQVAKTAQKFSPEGLAQAVERVGRGESVSDVAAEFVQAAAEIPASVEASAVGTTDLLRRTRRVLNENSIRGKFEGGTVSEQNQQQTRQRLFDDIEGLKAAERAGQGNGEAMKATGFDADTLAQANIKLDPEVIAKLSVITDPINYIPVGGAVAAVSKIGGKAFSAVIATTVSAEQATKFAKVLNSATEAAAKGRSVAATATGAVAQAAGGAIEGVGNAAQRTVKAVGGTAGGLGLGALLGRDIYSVLGGVAAAKVAPKVISATGRGIKAGGEILSGARPVPAALSLAGDTAKAGAVGAAKGLAEGAVISLPFELGARPEEEEQILGMVGLAGAIRGGVEGGRPVTRAAGRAAQNKLAESIFQRVEQTDAPESPTYGTEPTLDSAHSAAVATLPAPSQKLVNWGRELLREAGGEVYTLTNDEFVKAAGDNGVGYAVKIGEKIAPDGGSTPLVRVFLNASSEGLPHEFFHALESIDPTQADGLRKAVQAEWTPQQKKSFEQYYNTLRNGGLPESQWKTRLSGEQVASEAAAEVFSRLFLAQDLTGVAPSITQKAALFTSSIIDKLGSPLAAVGRARGEAGVSTLGVRPGVESTKLGQTWLANLLQRVDETGSLGETPKQSKTFEGLTPADITDTTPIRTKPTVIPMKGVTTPKPASVVPTTSAAPVIPPPTTPVTPAPVPAPVTPAPSGSRNIRTTRAAQDDFAGRRAEETGTVRAREIAKASSDPNTVARVAEISDLIESGSPVIEIEHSGAIAEGSARKPSGRTARRAEQEAAYIAEGLGAAPESIRDTYQKVFVPVRWETVAGKPQLLAMSLDKVIANAHKVSNEASLRGVGDLVPYEISGGKLTEAGWKSFVSDLRDYAANQQNGFRGDGQKLTRPTTDVGLSIPAENPAYNPVRLDEAKANFLNVVQGLNPPLTAREGSNLAKTIPGNVKGQILAEVNARTPERPAVIRPEDVTKQDFKSQPGRSIKETNPLRNQLAEAGVPVRELIEVTERINAENINKVTPRPDLDFSAPVTDTIRGGFLPFVENRKLKNALVSGQPELDGSFTIYEFTSDNPSRIGNGRRGVQELKNQYGKLQVEDPGPPGTESRAFWDRMVSEGLIDKLFLDPDTEGSFLPAPESGATVGDSVASVLNATPDEFVAMTKKWDGSLTKEAYRVGLNAKSVNDLFMLKTAQEAARARYKRAFATGNEQDGYSLSVMPQFFREAYEAATDSGSAAGSMGWRMSYPDAVPPFPEQAGSFLPEGREWADRALEAVQNPRGEHYVFGSTKSYNSYADSAAKLKAGYTPEEFRNFPRKVQKEIGSLLDAAHELGDVGYGAAYYPRLAGEGDVKGKTKAQIEALFDKQMGNKPGTSLGSFLPDDLKQSEVLKAELEQVKSGEKDGQTFNRDGTVFSPGDRALDVVTLASENILRSELSPERVEQFLAPYSEVLLSDDVKPGVFKLSASDKQGKERVSLDLNVVVDQQHRDNTVAFARANNQEAIFDLATFESIPTEGDGNTRLKDVSEISEAIRKLSQGEPVFDERGSFLPTAEEWDRRMAREKSKPAKAERGAKASSTNPTAWILPDGEVKGLTQSYHENDLASNSKDYNKRFGTKFPSDPSKVDRVDALNAGFVRMRYVPNNGTMTVEVGARKWSGQKSKVLDTLLAQSDRIDNLRINLIDDAGQAVDAVGDSVFNAEDRGAAITDLVNEIRVPRTKRPSKVGPTDIQRARALPGAGDFLPSQEIRFFKGWISPTGDFYDLAKVKSPTHEEFARQFLGLKSEASESLFDKGWVRFTPYGSDSAMVNTHEGRLLSEAQRKILSSWAKDSEGLHSLIFDNGNSYRVLWSENDQG